MTTDTPAKDEAHVELRHLREIVEAQRKELELLCDKISLGLILMTIEQMATVQPILEKYLPKKEVKNENANGGTTAPGTGPARS